MNKLDTMSGELFRIIADAAHSRGGTRSKGATAGGSTETSPFRQLLRTRLQLIRQLRVTRRIRRARTGPLDRTGLNMPPT